MVCGQAQSKPGAFGFSLPATAAAADAWPAASIPRQSWCTVFAALLPHLACLLRVPGLWLPCGRWHLLQTAPALVPVLVVWPAPQAKHSRAAPALLQSPRRLPPASPALPAQRLQSSIWQLRPLLAACLGWQMWTLLLLKVLAAAAAAVAVGAQEGDAGAPHEAPLSSAHTREATWACRQYNKANQGRGARWHPAGTQRRVVFEKTLMYRLDRLVLTELPTVSMKTAGGAQGQAVAPPAKRPKVLPPSVAAGQGGEAVPGEHFLSGVKVCRSGRPWQTGMRVAVLAAAAASAGRRRWAATH
jgi:hypothetical protein